MLSKKKKMSVITGMGKIYEGDFVGNLMGMSNIIQGSLYGSVTGMNNIIHGNLYGTNTGMNNRVYGKILPPKANSKEVSIKKIKKYMVLASSIGESQPLAVRNTNNSIANSNNIGKNSSPKDIASANRSFVIDTTIITDEMPRINAPTMIGTINCSGGSAFINNSELRSLDGRGFLISNGVVQSPSGKIIIDDIIYSTPVSFSDIKNGNAFPLDVVTPTRRPQIRVNNRSFISDNEEENVTEIKEEEEQEEPRHAKKKGTIFPSTSNNT